MIILLQEKKLQASENQVLRKIFGPKNDKVGWQFRILYNMVIHDLNRSPSIVKIVKSEVLIGWACS
jgi:hypothetical protein